MSSNKVDSYLARYNAMKTARSTTDTLWQGVADFCIPRKGNIVSTTTPGANLGRNIYDSTSMDAGNTASAGLVTNIFPAGEKWARLEPKRIKSEAVKDWFARASDATIETFYDSNFYEGGHETMIDAIFFCTYAMLADEDDETTVNFINIPVGTFCIAENHRGDVDVLAREFKFTARQCEQKWGRDNLSSEMIKALEAKDGAQKEKQFTIIHFIEPRADYDKGSTVGKKRPWSSCYFCTEDKKILDEGGYYKKPFAVGRLLRSNGELYGRGPGTDQLSRQRILNAMMRDFIIYGEKMVKPSWLMGEEQPNDPDNSPNGVTYWDSTSAGGKPEMVPVNPQGLQTNLEMMQILQTKVENGYYVNLFQMITALSQQKIERTAFEIEKLVAEQMNLFSPLFGRMTREFLTPMIERLFDILVRNSVPFWVKGVDGPLPLPPSEMLADDGTLMIEFNIAYISKIALAIKAAENQAFSTMLTILQQVTPLAPEVVNLFKFEDSLRDIAANVAFPARNIRTPVEYQQRLAAQAEAQKAATAPAQAEASTQAVKNLGPIAQQSAARKIIAGSERAA